MTPALENMMIVVRGKELPEWIVERLTGEIADDGSFDLEASDGVTKVRPGYAIFGVGGGVYTCSPKDVQAKLATVVGTANPVVSDLAEKQQRMRDVTAANRGKDKRKPKPTDPNYQLKLKPMVGTPPAPQFLPVESLLVDDSYQRSIEGGASRKMIVHIAENWDWRLCLPLLVSRRQSKLFVIDGQHRKEAAELRGDIPHLPVVVFDFDDPRAEAELFVQANRSRRTMSKLDDFHAAVVAGDPHCVAVNDVVNAAGLRVGREQAWQNWKPGEVVFTSVIGRVLKAHGHSICVQALGMIARAFDGHTLVGGGAMFDGLVSFIQQRAKQGAPIDAELMELVLAEGGLVGWKEAVENCDSSDDRAKVMCEAFASAYAEAEAQ